MSANFSHMAEIGGALFSTQVRTESSAKHMTSIGRANKTVKKYEHYV
ncbi:hypothetical protein QEL93_001581 [Pseudomonas putida]|nr:hypothetical protein [Pseudomonas putida]